MRSGVLSSAGSHVDDRSFRHEGTLEKYIGDALLAVWGAPFRNPDDALRAVRAAVDMQRAMREWTARAPHRPSFEIHIGLNTGHVAAGNIGSERYMQYATIGDTTNLASRICDAAGAGEILLAASTLERLRPLEWRTEELARVRLKGVDEPQPLFRLDWRRSGPTDA